MSERDLIIEKIKKLLRMKRGGTPDEIATALEMAAALARKHGIDLAKVDPDAEEQRITHVEELLKSKLPAEAKFAAAILVNFFNVQVVISRRYRPGGFWRRQVVLNLVGTDFDCAVAQYVFAFLQTHFRRAWSHRANRRLKNRIAFLNGMFIGLASKLEAERELNAVGEEGLILIGRAVELRKDYVKKHWETKDHDLDTDDSEASAARHAGMVAGQNTNIRKSVTQPSAPVRPSLPPPVGQLNLLSV